MKQASAAEYRLDRKADVRCRVPNSGTGAPAGSGHPAHDNIGASQDTAAIDGAEASVPDRGEVD